MKKNSQSTIWDNLIKIMPEFKNRIMHSTNYIDPLAANSLYNIWRNGTNVHDKKTFKKLPTIGVEEVNRMKDAGLIQQIGDNIKLTDKGEKVIRIMILGDDRSAFDDNGVIIDYGKALSNTKSARSVKRHKAASFDWWERFEKKSQNDNSDSEKYLSFLLSDKNVKKQLDLWGNDPSKLRSWKEAVDNSDWEYVYQNLDICNGWSKMSVNVFMDDLYDAVSLLIDSGKI